jgi:hypothetical protein
MCNLLNNRPTGCVNKSGPAASLFSQYTPTDTKINGKDRSINTKYAAGPFISFLYLSPYKNFLLLSFLYVHAPLQLIQKKKELLSVLYAERRTKKELRSKNWNDYNTRGYRE